MEKKCRFCELTKPAGSFEKNSGRKDGVSNYCIECLEGFRHQAKNYDETTSILRCLKCWAHRPTVQFYQDKTFGAYAPWCNKCRQEFIDSHTPPKIPKPLNTIPSLPPREKKYKCAKCHKEKERWEFGETNRGTRRSQCDLCRDEAERNRAAEKELNMTPRDKRHLHRLQNTGTQICNVCDIEKQLIDFPQDSSEILGVHTTCKECKKEKARIKSIQTKRSNKDKISLALSLALSRASAAGVHDAADLTFVGCIKLPTNTRTFKCRKCKLEKPLSEFAKGGSLREHDLWCKECSKARKRAHHKRTPWEQRIISGCRKRAKDKNVPFDMKPEDLYDPNTGALPIFCRYFPNVKIDYNHGPDRRKWPSVDRKVPALGYTSDNVCVVSLGANMWKSNGSNPEERKKIVALTSKNKSAPTLPNDSQISLFA